MMLIWNGAYEAHPHADTINLLLSIGENALSAINSETPVSPIPYAVSPHMDVTTRIKVLNQTHYYIQVRLTKQESCNGTDADLLALEGCFQNQKQFVDYTKQMFKWNHTICHLYIVYYRLLIDYPVFVYFGLPWTSIRNECTRWRRWLDSDEANALPTSDYSSSSFWKGTLPPYREKEYESEPSESPCSFHSFEEEPVDEGVATGSEMVISTSLGHLKMLTHNLVHID